MSPRATASSSATPLWDEVDRLRAAVRTATGRLSELEAQRAAGARRLQAAEEEVGAYFEQVGAGERERDPAVEAELVAAVREAGAGITLELTRDGRSGQPTTVLVDQRAQRLVVGARRAVQAAEDAVTAFMRRERAGLAAELTIEAEGARDAQAAALPALAAAVERDRAVRARWRELARVAGLPDTLPPSPLRGFDDDVTAAGGIPLAVPAALQDGAPA